MYVEVYDSGVCWGVLSVRSSRSGTPRREAPHQLLGAAR
jgi:hypothetical protein